MRPLRALLVDVGGTLVTASSIDLDTHRMRQLDRLCRAFGQRMPWFEPLVANGFPESEPPTWEHRTRLLVDAFLAGHGVTLTDAEFEQVRAACATYLAESARLEPGAVEALQAARSLGLRLAICSDVFWVTAEDSRSDWNRFGLDHYFDAFVTSHEVGFTKPHHAMFECALSQLGVDPAEAAMVGDRPERDVAGALALGIRAIWKRPPELAGRCAPTPTAEIETLWELPRVLTRWVESGGSEAVRS